MPTTHTMHYQFLTLRLVVALILVVLAQADYKLDDTNSTIQYGPAGNWTRSGFVVDTSKVVNGTLTHSTCSSEDDCYMTFPFVGTGINVYNVIREQLNISITVDENLPSTFVYSNTSCFVPEIGSTHPQGCYNVSVYNNQSLPYANHTLTIDMFTYIYSDISDALSDFYFDYAVISSPSQSPSSSPRTHKPLAAAIGGALGGVVAVIAVMLAVLCYRKRNHHRLTSAGTDGGPVEPSFQPNALTTTQPLQPDALHDWSPTTLVPDTHRQTNHFSSSTLPSKSTIPSEATATAHIPTSPAVVALPRNQHSLSSHLPQTAAEPARATSSTGMSAGLTEEQSELVQGLIRHKVPLPAVVGAIEGILRGEGQLGGAEGSSSGLTQSVERRAESPPVYNF